MKFETIRSHLEGIPFIPVNEARTLYDFILELKPEQCLELGFAYGASVCYIAAGLDELGKGHITAVDLERGREWQTPSIEENLEKTGLSNYVTVKREHVSYTWFLKKEIESKTENNICKPKYDFCYIDGPKNWTNDGFSFFLVDKLLKKNAWILFDDYAWSYAKAKEWSVKKLEECGILVSAMEDDERSQSHVERIFKLLVMQHPDYANFKVENDDWGWAQKTGESGNKSLEISYTFSPMDKIRQRFRNLMNKILR